MQLRRRFTLLMALAAVIWAATVWTWKYDAEGYSQGMNSIVFWLHWLIPLCAALLAWERLRYAVLAPVVSALADLGLLAVWDLLLHNLGRVRPAAPGARTDAGWVHVVEFAVIFALSGVILGLAVFALGWLSRREE
jgi:hypothetical protein